MGPDNVLTMYEYGFDFAEKRICEYLREIETTTKCENVSVNEKKGPHEDGLESCL